MGKNNALACIVALGACIVAPSSAFASPMDPDERYVVVNDGDSLVLQDIGDEYYSVSRTEDGFLVVAGSRGVLYYADENGEPSKFKARSLRKRSGAEKAFLNGIDRDRAFRAHRKKVPDRTEFDVGQRESRAPCIELVMPFSYLILCRSLFLLPSIFPSITVFSNESDLHIRWPKY